MASPNSRPRTQKAMPIRSKLWPLMRPRNCTDDKSGSFRLASPPALDEGCDSAFVALRTISAETAAPIFAKRQPRDATPASQVRIGIPPASSIRDNHVFRYFSPTHESARERSLPGERNFGVPNTLPLQDLTRSAELGRVGRVLAGNSRMNMPPHKTISYSTSAEGGQTTSSPWDVMEKLLTSSL